MVWRLVRRQHGVISHAQLRALGYSRKAIEHRLAKGRLYSLFPCVYAVGRRDVGRHGMWMAAVLACGEGAVLSHESAGQLLGFWPMQGHRIHVSLPSPADRRPSGIRVHRRAALSPRDLGVFLNIPVTSPACTLADLAASHGRRTIERAVNEADQAGVISVGQLHVELSQMPQGRRGVKALEQILAPGTFVLTDSELERLFVPLARRAGLPKPETGAEVNGFDVDFYFADLGLVIETDGGAFHRTPTQQRNDRRRDHAHTLAGLTPLRFTHFQVAREPGYVEKVLRTATELLAAARGPGAPMPPPWPPGPAACA